MSKKMKDDDLHADAWSRFERAMDVVAKAPPQHREKPKRKSKVSPKRRKKKPGK